MSIQIVKVEIRKLALPLVHGFKIGSAKITEKETVIVKLVSEEGLTGYGEATTFSNPVFTRETGENVILDLKNILMPKILGERFESPEELVASYREVKDCHSAKTAIECAFWHLFSLTENKSLKKLFGGVKSEIPVGESIGLKKKIGETLEEVELRLREGYLRVKLKIKPGWDIDLVKAVRQKWPKVVLGVDANATYNISEHGGILKLLDSFGLSMLEQPFAASRFADHAALQRILKTPICLDESITSLGDLKEALRIGSCRIVNIKPLRVGGIIESIKIHDYAASHSVGVFCGGMLETGIGRAFNIALASKSNFIYPADMSPYQIFFSEDLIDPSYVVEQDGHIKVPDVPGLGYKVRDDLVEKYTVFKLESVHG